MSEADVQQVLSLLAREWAALPDYLRPSAVWIRMGLPITAGDDPSEHFPPAERVWYLDENGLSERDPWTFARFYATHYERPWDSRFTSPLVSDVFGRTHRIGLAGFSPFADSDDIYVEHLYGRLHGRGRLLRFSPDGSLHVITDLWVS